MRIKYYHCIRAISITVVVFIIGLKMEQSVVAQVPPWVQPLIITPNEVVYISDNGGYIDYNLDEDCPSDIHGSNDQSIIDPSYDEHTIVHLINVKRRENGLPPVKLNNSLATSAQTYSQFMSQQSTFGHFAGEQLGCSLHELVSKFYGEEFEFAGEVILSNVDEIDTGTDETAYISPTLVLTSWLESEDHPLGYTHRQVVLGDENVLGANKDWREVGVGQYGLQQGWDAVFWTAHFGSKSDVYPLIINNEAITTTSPLVELYVWGEWEKISILNEDDSKTDVTKEAERTPYGYSIDWGLGSHYGDVTVKAEVTAHDITHIISDTIYRNPPELRLLDRFASNHTVSKSVQDAFPATSIVRDNRSWHVGAGEEGFGYAITNQAYGSIKSNAVDVNATSSYEVSVDVKGEIAADASRSGLSARVYYYSDLAGTQRIPHWDSIASGAIQLQDWETFTETITPPTGTQSVRIMLIGYQFSGWVAFDNVSLYELDSNGNHVNGNLITSPGFESTTGWATSEHSNFPATSIVRHNQGWHVGSGKSGYGYAITNQAYGSIKSKEFEVDPASSYEVSVDIKGEIAADSSRSGLSARVYYYSDLAGTQRIPHWDSIAGGAIQRQDWKTFTKTITPPAGTRSVRIMLIGYQFSGWVAFDNVSLYELDNNSNYVNGNLITSPGFESTTGWTTSEHSNFPATSIVRHNQGWHVGSGKSGYGYAITNQAYGSIKSTSMPVQENRSYDISVDVKGEIAADASRSGLSARVYYYSDLAGTQRIPHWDSIASGAIQLQDWETFTKTVTPPANAKSARIMLIGYQFSGWVAFDNVLVYER